VAGLILHDPALEMGYGELEGVREVVSGIPTVSYTSDEYGPTHSHYQSTLDAVYVYVVPWSEFPIVPSYPHYPHSRCGARWEQLETL